MGGVLRPVLLTAKNVELFFNRSGAFLKSLRNFAYRAGKGGKVLRRL